MTSNRPTDSSTFPDPTYNQPPYPVPPHHPSQEVYHHRCSHHDEKSGEQHAGRLPFIIDGASKVAMDDILKEAMDSLTLSTTLLAPYAIFRQTYD